MAWKTITTFAVLAFLATAASMSNAWGQGGAVPGYDAYAATSIVRDRPWVVEAYDEAVIPAQEAGVLTSLDLANADGTPIPDAAGRPIRVTEGLTVQKDQVLAVIDDRLAETAVRVAQDKLAVAEKEADNDVNLRFADTSYKVAIKEYEQSLEANKQQEGAVPLLELLRRWLEMEKAFLQIDQAKHDLDIAKVSVNVRKTELEQAQQMLERRRVKSPIDGEINRVTPHIGEWVQPGDEVFHVIRLDRLEVHGWESMEQGLRPSQLKGRRAIVKFLGPGQVMDSVEGVVRHASPRIEQGNFFKVYVDVINVKDAQGNWKLLPGMKVQDVEILAQ